MTDTTPATAGENSAGGRSPPAQPTLMRDLLDPVVLGQFIEPTKLEHYRVRFEGILSRHGLGERPIERVSFAQVASAAVSQRPMNLWLPALDDSQFNIPAAFFQVTWAAWRKVAFAWVLVALWIGLIALDLVLKPALGISLFALILVPAIIGFGVLGSSLFLYQIAREVRSGAIRRDKTSVAGAATAIALIVGGGVTTALYEERDAARNCASSDAQNLVTTIVRDHYDPQGRLNLLAKVELDAIRQRELVGQVQHCAAGLTLTGPNNLILTRSHPISYTLDVTTDRRLYATVERLP
jgi:hypothetical protein